MKVRNESSKASPDAMEKEFDRHMQFETWKSEPKIR